MTIAPITTRDFDVGPITAGDSRQIRVSVKVKDAVTGLVEDYPTTVGSVEIVFTTKARLSPEAGVLIQKKFSTGGIIVDPLLTPEDGEVLVLLDVSDTNLPTGWYWWDVELTVLTTGERTTVAKGRLFIEAGVT